MTAAISMDDGVLSLWQSSNRLIQHGIDQGGIGAAADCPVHNQTIETVYKRREIELTLRKSESRDICQLFFIWVIRIEITTKDILYRWRYFSQIRTILFLLCPKHYQIFVLHNLS